MGNKNKMDGDSLYKLVGQAVDMTIAEGTICTGFSVARVMANLRTITSPKAWSKEYLFERWAKFLIAVYANSCGKRSGVKGKGVYFDEESLNRAVAEGLYINQADLAKHHTAKAEKLGEHAEHLKVVKGATDGQNRLNTEDTELNMENLYEEMSLDTLIDIIKEMDSE